jgi:hypothetical protein
LEYSMTTQLETTSAVIVHVTGDNKAERQMSVAHNASVAALQALIVCKGKIGAFARDGFARGGVAEIADKAAWPSCNYRPFAEYLSARTGKPVTISGRAAFESMADRYADLVLTAKIAKTKKDGTTSNGYVLDKKTLALKPGAALAEAMELHAFCVGVSEMAFNKSAERKAKHEADKAAQTYDGEVPSLT